MTSRAATALATSNRVCNGEHIYRTGGLSAASVFLQYTLPRSLMLLFRRLYGVCQASWAMILSKMKIIALALQEMAPIRETANRVLSYA